MVTKDKSTIFTYQLHFNSPITYLFIGLALILVTSCKFDIGADKIANILDKSIQRLESQSVAWQSVLQDTSTQLVQAGQSTLANEVNNIVSSAIGYSGLEARCDVDFLRNRARESLRRLKAVYTGETITLTPVFCKPIPTTVDMNLPPERRPYIEMLGYNLDKANLRAFLVDNQNQRVDISQHLAGLGQYLITLNLGANGAPLSTASQKIELQTEGGGMLGDINVIQPPTISRYSVTVKFNKIYVKDASEGFCGHYTGEFSIDLGVNGKYRKLNTMQVRSGHEYPLENIEEVVEVDENGEVDIYTNGVELDDESSAIWDVSIFGCSTEANDPLGNALKKYNKNNNWGQTGGQFIETNHYIRHYSKISPLSLVNREPLKT